MYSSSPLRNVCLRRRQQYFSTIHPPARKKQHLSSSAPCATQQPRQHGGTLCPRADAPHALDVVNVNLLLAGAVLVFRVGVVAVLVELEADALVALVAVRVCLVDLCVFGQLAVRF